MGGDRTSEYSISIDGDHITLTIVGEVSRDVGMGYTVQAHALGAELGIKCFLIDVRRARNTESKMMNYRIAYREVREQPLIDPQACVAVLADPDDHTHDFWEAVARQSGLDMTLFRDREEALAHLAEAARRLHLSSGEAGSVG